MNKILRLFLPALMLAAFVASAPAQESSIGKRTCRILFLMAPAGAPETLHLFDGKQLREVELPRMSFSPMYELPPGDLILKLLPAPPTEGQAPDPRAPSAKVPAAMKDCYLLVAADPENPVVPVRMQVVDASEAKLKKGQMLWMNLTENMVFGKVGSNQLAMRPRAVATLDSPAAGAEPYPVELDFRMPGGDRDMPLCETQWQHDPRARIVVFIFEEGGRRAPRVLGFSDFRPASEE